MSELEPMSMRDAKPTYSVSLRGSLADFYYELTVRKKDEDAKYFLEELLISDDEDIVKLREGEKIIIGRESERGMFFPDW